MTHYDVFATNLEYPYDPTYYNLIGKMDDDYIYILKQNGLTIYDKIYQNQKVAYYDTMVGSCIDINSSYLFIATTNNGVLRINKDDITGTIESPIDLTDYVEEYAKTPFIEDNNVSYISCSEYFVCIVTNQSVEHFSVDKSYRSFSSNSFADKCYQVPDGSFLYTTNGGTNLYKINDYRKNWLTPDVNYDNVFNGSIVINSIDYDWPKAYLGTISGVYIVDDDKSFSVINTTTFPRLESNEIVYAEHKFGRVFASTISGVYIINENELVNYFDKEGGAIVLEEDIIGMDA